MKLKDKLQTIFNNDYPGIDTFIRDVIIPILGDDIDYKNVDLASKPEYAEKATKTGIDKLIWVADITEQNYNAGKISLFDVTLDNTVNVERSRVNIQQLIRSIVANYRHLLIVFHYEDVNGKAWRFSYAHKLDSLTHTTSAKRYTYVFGRDFRARTAADRFQILADSPKRDNNFEEAFSVQALSDEFFKKYRDIYADFVQYITGKRYEKIKNKWKEVLKEEPNAETFSQFKNDDKRVRDYIKKMLGRLTFLCFLQRKGWMKNDNNFLQNLYQTSSLRDDFLDAVLEPLFFGVLNTPPEKRNEVFFKNGWNTELADEWEGIPYLNGGLFEQTREDKLTVKFPKKLFQELFNFLGEYNFTIDENDPDDAEIGIDPEMLGRVFESLLEDNKDKGAYYTPKEIVQYMCRQSIIEYLKTHTDQSLHADIEDLINKGLVNNALQNKDNARNLYKFLKEVTVCDPAIGSGAFPMGILNVLFTARQHLYGFLKESEPFNPLEVKKSIIRDNIYGVDIEQGAVDIARLRFWLAILVEEQSATPLPNLDYRIVRGNSLITTFNDEYIQLPENPDGRTKLAKLKKELYQLQNDLFDLNGDGKLQREIEIKCKILEIIKVQLGIDKANAQEKSRIESDIFEDNKLSGKALKKAQQARAIEAIKGKSLFALNNLITSLTTPATSLADRAHIDIKFFDWKIIFSNIFNDNASASGFDIVIGNPPYGAKLSTKDKVIFKELYSDVHMRTPETYCYFISNAVRLAKYNDAIISYIVPNNMLYQNENERTRVLLAINNTLIRAINLGDNTFENADVPTCIFISKTGETDNYQILYSDYRKYNIKNIIWDKDIEPLSIQLLSTVPAYILGMSEADIKIINTIKSHGVAIDDLAEEMACGISSGGDKIFRVDISTVSAYNLEKSLLHKVLSGSDISEYVINYSGDEIIYLTRDSDIECYPSTRDYLYLYYNELNNRSETRKGILPWFSLNRNRYPMLFEEEKIIMRQTSDSIRCVYDNEGFYTLDSILIFKKNTNEYSYKYIASVLNSTLTDFLYKKLTQEEGRAFAQVKPANVRKLYIPKASIKEQNLLETLYDYQHYCYSQIIADNSITELFVDLFNDIIDGCVYELFFREHMKERGIDIIPYLYEIIKPIEGQDDYDTFNTIASVHSYIFTTNNPVRTRLKLFVSRSPEYIKPIIQH